MKNQIISTANNPISGVFGTGQVIIYGGYTSTQTYTWTVPPGIGAVRARCWGGGGFGGGGSGGAGAGGFAMKAIYDLTGVTSIAVTVGLGNATSGSASGGTSSFGSYVSATGGAGGTLGGAGGSGSGGDINFSGGNSNTAGSGGGSPSIFGRGTNANFYIPTGGAGGGYYTGAGSQNIPNGFLGLGGYRNTSGNTYVFIPPTTGFGSQFSIDLIGTGGGAGRNSSGINGGGGSDNANGSNGGYPGGGGGYFGAGGFGMVIVEW